jgi:hypothetical protein
VAVDRQGEHDVRLSSATFSLREMCFDCYPFSDRFDVAVIKLNPLAEYPEEYEVTSGRLREILKAILKTAA